MKREATYVAREILAADSKMQVDLACKRVLSSKIILAWMMRRLMEQYRNYTEEEIAEKFIDDASIELFESVTPGLTNLVEAATTENPESSVANEATVFFDVLFTAHLPAECQTELQICLKIDVEAQKEYRPGYPIEKRGIYYMSRQISSQIVNVNHGKSYARLQKVYGIWICLGKDIPEADKQSITRFYFTKEDIFGNANVRKEDYDLMEMYMVRLGEGETEDELLGMLQTLFGNGLTARERIDELESKYGIPMTREFEEEVADMCSYSDYIEERGIDTGLKRGLQQGLQLGIQALIETCKELNCSWEVTVQKIQEKFELSSDEAEEYLKTYWK